MLDNLQEHIENSSAVPLTGKVVRYTLKAFVQVARRELICACVDKGDRVVGIAILLPSIAEAVRESNGRLTPLGMLRIRRAVRKPGEVLDCALVGVLPEYINTGVSSVIFAGVTEGAIKLNIKKAESNPLLETNDKIHSSFKFTGGVLVRRRRFYIKKLT